jgi:hypothetical protein
MSEKSKQKMLAARAALARRFHEGADTLCVVILDVLVFLCEENPSEALSTHPDFLAGRSIYPKRKDAESFLAYAHKQWFHHQLSKMRVLVEDEPTKGWLAPYRVTFYADDITGLLPDQVFGLLEVLPLTRLILVELALDFSPLTAVDRTFVRSHGYFGRSQRDRSTKNEDGDWWGARNGTKRVKSYLKSDVGGHRVEFRVRRRFLENYGVTDIYDFRRFVDVLPHRHIRFARFDHQRLRSQLAKKGFNAARTRRTLQQVAEMGADLSATLKYLRGDVGLDNVTRFLVPLPENQLVSEALSKWAASWPSAPSRLVKPR